MNDMPFAFLVPVVAVAALTACTPPAKQPVLNVHDAHTVVPAVPGNPSAVFLRISGGPRNVQLLSVLAPAALRAEIHESVKENGVVSMKQLTAVDVPAGQDVVFAHGGKHIMVWGMNAGAIKMGKMPMTFIFSNSDRIVADVRIDAAPAAAAPHDADMAKMGSAKMDSEGK